MPDLLVSPPSVYDRPALVAHLAAMKALAPEIGNRDLLIAEAAHLLAEHDQLFASAKAPEAAE